MRAATLTQHIPILMTRPEGSNAPFVNRIAPDLRRYLQVLTSPLIVIESLKPVDDIGLDDAAIFTSGHGVANAPAGKGRLAYCVGERTANRAKLAGWNAQFAGTDAESLIEGLRQIAPDKALHHFHGVHVRVDVADKLQKIGFAVSHSTVYDQVLQPLTNQALTAIFGEVPVLVPLFSPRTAKHFAELVSASANTIVFAMSAAIAEECKAVGFSRICIAAEPTAQSMVSQLENWLMENRPG